MALAIYRTRVVGGVVPDAPPSSVFAQANISRGEATYRRCCASRKRYVLKDAIVPYGCDMPSARYSPCGRVIFVGGVLPDAPLLSTFAQRTYRMALAIYRVCVSKHIVRRSRISPMLRFAQAICPYGRDISLWTRYAYGAIFALRASELSCGHEIPFGNEIRLRRMNCPADMKFPAGVKFTFR